MTHERRFTPDQLFHLANSAVTKIDLLGPEGTARCTSDEIVAMATLIELANLLPSPDPVNETPKERTGT